MMKHLWVSLVVLGLTACAQFPEVDNAMMNDSTATEFPKLVPLESIAYPDTSARLDETSEDDLQGRIYGLQRRADKLSKTSTD